MKNQYEPITSYHIVSHHSLSYYFNCLIGIHIGIEYDWSLKRLGVSFVDALSLYPSSLGTIEPWQVPEGLELSRRGPFLPPGDS